MARTDNLTNFLTDVASAIKTKKGDSTPILASRFDEEILTLPAGGAKIAPSSMSFQNQTISSIDLSNIDDINITGSSYMFNNCPNLTSIDLGNWTLSKSENFAYMFGSCLNLENINLTNIDTSKVISMNNTFYKCEKLTELDLSSKNLNNVTSMTYLCALSSISKLLLPSSMPKVTDISYLFSQSKASKIEVNDVTFDKLTGLQRVCQSTSCEEISLKGWVIPLCNSFSYTFYNSSKLKKINLQGITGVTSGSINCNYMFFGCSKLEEIDMRDLNLTNVTSSTSMMNSVPKTCKIIVKGEAEKTWFNGKFSGYNVVTVDEL